MKKPLSIISQITAVIAVASIVVSCSKPQAPAAATVVNTGGESIVYVNSDSLLTNYEYFKDVKAVFDEKSKKAQADLSEKGQAFQREVADYQKNGASLSAAQRQQTEERLGRKQQELAANNQNAGQALQRDEAAENEKLYTKVSEFMKSYAKEKGYKFVLTFSKTDPTVLYGDPGLDVTKEVLTRLNDAYKKEKK